MSTTASVFEGVMLVCFGASWPFSIWKSWRTRNVTGKSVVFLWLIFFGYLAGITNKCIRSLGPEESLELVTALYAVNALLVFVDVLLYYRYRRLANRV